MECRYFEVLLLCAVRCVYAKAEFVGKLVLKHFVQKLSKFYCHVLKFRTLFILFFFTVYYFSDILIPWEHIQVGKLVCFIVFILYVVFLVRFFVKFGIMHFNG